MKYDFEKRIRALIVDDEPLARQNISLLLKNDPDVDIIGECASGLDAVRFMKKELPDLLFLDIQMPEMNGFEVLEQIDTERIPSIIFVTAYDQYAIRAFEVHALDYLLKPFSDSRFEKSLQQAKTQFENRDINLLSKRLIALLEDREIIGPAPPKRPSYLSRLMIKTTSRVFFLKVDEIDWIEAADYYVKIHYGRRAHLLRETMSDLEARLDPEKFVRVHRSTIVNLDRVRELQPHFNGEYLVILNDGTELKLSRSRRERLEQMLNLNGQ